MPLFIFAKSKIPDETGAVMVFGLLGQRPQEPMPIKSGVGNLKHDTILDPIKTRTAWGQMVKDIRVEQHLSQRQLAELSGINRNVLRRLENEGGSANVDVLERLLEILGYELDAHNVKKFLN